MTIKYECKLRDFDFWGGALVRAHKLTWDELDQIEEHLKLTYGDEIIDATELNDYIWFEEETYLPIIGLTQEQFDAR